MTAHTPTAHAAAQAGMSEADFGAFVMRAMFLDRPDPVAAWGEVRETQARLIERLTRADTVRIEAPGTDLTLRVGGSASTAETSPIRGVRGGTAPASPATIPIGIDGRTY